MKRIKRMLCFLLACVLLGCFAAGCASSAAALDRPEEIDGDNDFGADAAADKQTLLAMEKSLPATLDLRNYNGKNYVTPVKQQKPYSSCWTFAMAAAAEISYLYENDLGVPAGEVNDGMNFSEKYISWYMHHLLTSEDITAGAMPASQVGEGYDLSVPEQKDRNFCYDIFGNSCFGANFFASGFGPVDENTVVNGEKPYLYAGAKRLTDDHGYSRDDDWTLPLNAQYRFPDVEAYFKSSYLLPSPAAKDNEGKYQFNREGLAAIKSELSKGRGVSVGFHADRSLPGQEQTAEGYINTDNWAHYCNAEESVNHLVTIVGYDDNYPKEKFTRKVQGQEVDGSTPPENGAFIVKNSWGALTDKDRAAAVKNADGTLRYENPNATDWGIDGTGYFYLSYYDHSMVTPMTFAFYKNSESAYHELNYDQYDLMQDVNYMDVTYTDNTRAANVFTAEEDEYLYQISVMISKPLAKIKYQIYTDVKDKPESGKLAESGEVEKQFAGYQRIDLKDKIFLSKGTRYAVVIRQEALDENGKQATPVTYSLCINSDSSEGVTIRSIINQGESFVDTGAGWTDLSLFKESLEQSYYDAYVKQLTPDEAAKKYTNGVKDFQLDNLPIKAFLIPARNVDENIEEKE